jgi:hypothetical protein
MIIYINTTSGKHFKIDLTGLNANPNTFTIDDLKKKIFDQEHIPKEQQKLTLGKKTLDDVKSLSSLKISNESTIWLQVKRTNNN